MSQTKPLSSLPVISSLAEGDNIVLASGKQITPTNMIAATKRITTSFRVPGGEGWVRLLTVNRAQSTADIISISPQNDGVSTVGYPILCAFSINSPRQGHSSGNKVKLLVGNPSQIQKMRLVSHCDNTSDVTYLEAYIHTSLNIVVAISSNSVAELSDGYVPGDISFSNPIVVECDLVGGGRNILIYNLLKADKVERRAA